MYTVTYTKYVSFSSLTPNTPHYILSTYQPTLSIAKDITLHVVARRLLNLCDFFISGESNLVNIVIVSFFVKRYGNTILEVQYTIRSPKDYKCMS